MKDKLKNTDIVELRDIHNVVKDIKGGINVCMDQKYGGSLLKLIYSGIDTMAYLTIPDGLTPRKTAKKQKEHFKLWVDNYMRFLHPRCKSEYIWEARNGLLHTHGTQSVGVKEGKVPRIFYYAKNYPPISRALSNGEQVIFLSIPTLIREFFKGMDQFIVDVYSNDKKRAVAEERCERMLQVFEDFDEFVRQGTTI